MRHLYHASSTWPTASPPRRLHPHLCRESLLTGSCHAGHTPTNANESCILTCLRSIPPHTKTTSRYATHRPAPHRPLLPCLIQYCNRSIGAAAYTFFPYCTVLYLLDFDILHVLLSSSRALCDAHLISVPPMTPRRPPVTPTYNAFLCPSFFSSPTYTCSLISAYSF